MATLERTPSRHTSLQRMLELEKQHKLNRLHSHQASSTAATAAMDNGRTPSDLHRSASLNRQQQQYLMLQAAQRSVTLPSLSLAIPTGGRSSHQRARYDQHVDQDSDNAHAYEMGVEPLQKQVKFLALDEDDEDEEDEVDDDASMTDQSSICQSPSWEHYGNRKKDKKKLEAERKKEKEQQEKELKKSKKRFTARLSKLPPGWSKPVLDSTSRSMSDSVLDSAARLPGSSSLSPSEGSNGLQTSQSAMGWHMQANSQDGLHSTTGEVKSRQQMPKSHSIGPGGFTPQASTSTPKDARLSRDAHPPSASRTPMLRQASTTTRGRSSHGVSSTAKVSSGQERSLGQPGVQTNSSQESLQASPAEAERGRSKTGYVRHHRDQSNERALAGFTETQLVDIAMSQWPSEAGQAHPRRATLTTEAKALTEKLGGFKTRVEHVEENGQDHNQVKAQISPDYFSRPDQVQASTIPEPVSPMDDLTTPQESATKDDQVEDTSRMTTPTKDSSPERPKPQASDPIASRQFIFPTTSMQPIFLSSMSSKASSVTSVSSTTSKKGRTFKEAFAALSGYRSSLPATPHDPSVSKPSPLPFRSRMSMTTSVSTQNDSASAATGVSKPVLGVPKETPSEKPATKTANTQAGGRISEGSSSSSAYDDGSPLPSPVTTPDNSRPQSCKGISIAADTTVVSGEGSPIADDDKTIREPSDASSGSTRTGTPRQDVFSQDAKKPKQDESWSRTALPMDLDFDAQSFVTSLSNFDNVDNLEDEWAKNRRMTTSPRAQLLAQQATKPQSGESTNLAGQNNTQQSLSQQTLSTPSLIDTSERAAEPDLMVFGSSEAHKIPPRSQRRKQAMSDQFASERLLEQLDLRELKAFKVLKAQGLRQQLATQQEEDELEGPYEMVEDTSRERVGASAFEDESQNTEKRPRAAHSPRMRQGNAFDSHQKAVPAVAEDLMEFKAPPVRRAVTATSVHSSSSSAFSTEGVAVDLSASAPSLTSSFMPPPDVHTTTSAPKGRPSRSATSASYSAHSSAKLPPKIAVLPSSASAPTSPGLSQGTRPSGPGPVSILKQTGRSHSTPPVPYEPRPGPVLSALPKHMQHQGGGTARPSTALTDIRGAPVAKMFVECCSCKFYHDMPSKLYECMARPDAIVEDKMLGISGAITTMVKCPWCTHNMSTQCCAGYAAVVYLKERLH